MNNYSTSFFTCSVSCLSRMGGGGGRGKRGGLTYFRGKRQVINMQGTGKTEDCGGSALCTGKGR
jgi:hypothetical protein